jgi:hypothetical protein
MTIYYSIWDGSILLGVDFKASSAEEMNSTLAELNNVSSNQSDHLNLLKDIIMPKVYIKSLVNITDKDIGSVSILATKTNNFQSSGENKIVFLELNDLYSQ